MKVMRVISSLALVASIAAFPACAGKRTEPLPWSPPPYFAQERFVEINGINICYIEAGREHAETIIFVHGLSGNLQNWWDQYDYFKNEYHVVLFDNPGHGKSEKDCHDKCTIELFSRTLVGLMDELDIGQAVIVGNSMGGHIAAYTAIHYPERVSKLVLCDAAGSGNIGYLSYLIPLASPAAFKALGMTKGTQYKGEDYKTRARAEFVRSFAHSDEEQPYLKALTQAARSVGRTSLGDELPGIAAATLIIWGENDPLIPLRVMKVFEEQIPHAQTYLARGAGHTPNMEYPLEFNCVLERFLKDQSLEICHNAR